MSTALFLGRDFCNGSKTAAALRDRRGARRRLVRSDAFACHGLRGSIVVDLIELLLKFVFVLLESVCTSLQLSQKAFYFLFGQFCDVKAIYAAKTHGLPPFVVARQSVTDINRISKLGFYPVMHEAFAAF